MQKPQTSNPLVTITVCNYNQARWVVEALESARNQTYPNVELIIVDDCSTDNSIAVIESWIAAHQVKCRFIKHERNQGICRVINNAMEITNGKYISMVAADDVWLPKKIARQVQIMEDSTDDVGVIYSDAFQIDEQGKLLPQMFIGAHRKFAMPPEGFLFDVLMEGNFIPAMTTLIRRECYSQVGIYDEELCLEDWDMWLRISRHFKFKYFPEPTAKYRIVSNSMVRARSAEIQATCNWMLVKYLRRGWLSGEIRRYAASLQESRACQAYRQRLEGRLLEATWAFRTRRCARTAFLLLCIGIGLSHSRFEQGLRLLRGLKHKLRPGQVP